jgi:hypothetical protein
LKKADVERLLAGYDADPVGSLTVALRTVLDRPHDDWPSLVAAAPFTSDRRAALVSGDQTALDVLARELNELRDLHLTD